MRLYSTLQRDEGRAPRAARARSGSTSAARPSTSGSTSATRGPFVISMWLRALARAPGLRGDARREHHRHQRQDLRRRARARAPSSPRTRRSGTVEDTDLLGLGRPDLEPKATETIPEIVALIEELIARRPRLRGRRRRLLPRRALPEYGALSGPAARPGRRSRRRGEPAQGGPARLRALEGEQAGRGHVVGLAVGPRPPGLAHRVLGDGGEVPRRRRSRSTSAGSTSSSRTTRTSSRSRAAPGASSRRSGCTTGCSS